LVNRSECRSQMTIDMFRLWWSDSGPFLFDDLSPG
jgi:hypothetical protein